MANTVFQAKMAAAAKAAAEAAAIATMQERLEKLYCARDSGELRVTFKAGGYETTTEYRSQSEIMLAIGSLERRLGMQRATNIVVHGRKGWFRRNEG
jgi:hypothetical protein